MPGFDGTGPQGSGPNGRGLGPCGQGRAPYRRSFWGFRRGGRGRGFGFRWPGSYPVDEKVDLESEKSWLSQRLNDINQRLSEIQEE
mgnify:CR=1 FL=1